LCSACVAKALATTSQFESQTLVPGAAFVEVGGINGRLLQPSQRKATIAVPVRLIGSYLLMTGIDFSALDRELKKGAAELLLLSVLEARPRHGYELGKLIETWSGGRLVFHLDSLYPLLYRLEERGWIKGTWVEKPNLHLRPNAIIIP
jgi:hypothetical protein